MKHPWETVPLSDYENHMQLSQVQQLPLLNQIMKEQLTAYPIQSVVILGVAGGNGLEHLAPLHLQKVYGIDVNQEYLARCRERYSHFQKWLSLLCLDLSNFNASLPKADLVIANLLVEYIGLPAFVRLLKKSQPPYVSCVIQQNLGESFVSHSPYEASFSEIARLHTDIHRDALVRQLNGLGYSLILEQNYPLPSQKQFLRTDFSLERAVDAVMSPKNHQRIL